MDRGDKNVHAAAFTRNVLALTMGVSSQSFRFGTLLRIQTLNKIILQEFALAAWTVGCSDPNFLDLSMGQRACSTWSQCYRGPFRSPLYAHSVHLLQDPLSVVC